MDGFILGFASFVIVLVPLVIIHEFGHFIAAKLSGITVLEFGIGFPPRAAVLFTRGDTIYTLNWLPIGGFVRPYGEDFVRQKSEEELSADRQEIIERSIENPKSVFQATPWQRLFFMAAGPGINFLAALVLYIVIALAGWPFLEADATITEIMPDSVAASADLQIGDIVRAVDGETTESAGEVDTLLEESDAETVSLLVERDGEELTIPVTLPENRVQYDDIERVYISGVYEDSPADDAGFESEDVIVAVTDSEGTTEITSVEQLQDYTDDHNNIEMIVTVVREGEVLEIPVTPEEVDGDPRMGIGIQPVGTLDIGAVAINRDTEVVPKALPPGEAIARGTEEFVDAHRALGELVSALFAGDIEPEAARPVSPVGIGQIGGPVLDRTLDEGAMYPIVMFAALISIALAITNLLPIPGLDGGRILFVIIELIRGKPMEPEREGVFHFIGLLFLLGLVAITVINDIVNPIDLSSLR
ncbi:MAG: RIP metalloprotease RseP [Chloroflexi bacterium]|nr:RIP metalloprotease RseP [Chloroflexota bacterium]